MAAWITTTDLRNHVGAKSAGDEDKFEEAVEIACSKVEELCGPIEWATIVDELVPAPLRARARILQCRPTRGITAVETVDGVALGTDEFTIGRQSLTPASTYAGVDLMVTYSTGYFDPAGNGVAPAWARGMAKMIGAQYLRIAKRFTLQGDDLTQTTFVVPAAAMDLGSDYLLLDRPLR